MRVNNIKYIVEQKFRLRQLQRLYTIQADLLFSFLIKKKKEEALLSARVLYDL